MSVLLFIYFTVGRLHNQNWGRRTGFPWSQRLDAALSGIFKLPDYRKPEDLSSLIDWFGGSVADPDPSDPYVFVFLWVIFALLDPDHNTRKTYINVRICNYQCCGSGSVCFWASWIRIQIHKSEVWIRIRILLSSSKKSKKTLVPNVL